LSGVPLKIWHVFRALLSGAFALVCFLTLLAALAASAARTSALNESVYQNFIEHPAIQKKIDGIIVQSTGLWQVRSYDESVYWTVFNLLKAELITPFQSGLPPQFTAYLSGETNSFDPVLNLYETRGKIKWILDQAIQEKIPFFLVESIQRNIDRVFTRYVPFTLRLLPLLGVTPKMEEDMRAFVSDFQEYSRYRGILYLLPLVSLALCFILMRGKRAFPEYLASFLGGMALCFALPIALFSKQLTEIALTALNLQGRGGEETTAFISSALPFFWGYFADSLFILAAACFCILLCILCIRRRGRRGAG